MKIDSKMCLLQIDIQNFYFAGGKWELENPEIACTNAKQLLNKFRDSNRLVVHICHNSEPGMEIHEDVFPLKNEKVIIKNEVNSFKGTDLLVFLQENDIENLIICGMMTHMCVEAATRAGHDHGFKCTVIHDACATRSLTIKDKVISAQDVHYTALATLSGSYAKIIDTATMLQKFEELKLDA